MNNLEKPNELKEKYNNGNCDDVMWEGVKMDAKELLEEVKNKISKTVIACRKLSTLGAYQCGDFIDGKSFLCSKCKDLTEIRDEELKKAIKILEGILKP